MICHPAARAEADLWLDLAPCPRCDGAGEGHIPGGGRYRCELCVGTGWPDQRTCWSCGQLEDESRDGHLKCLVTALVDRKAGFRRWVREVAQTRGAA